MYNMKKYLPLLFLTIIIVLSSCDGRNKAFRTAADDLKDSKVLDSFSETTTYFPETYVEVVTDTLLNNGLQVKIKTYTDMEDIILNEFVADSIKYKHYYRNYTGEIHIAHNKTLVFDQKIDKSLFKALSPDFNWKEAIMGQIVLDQENTNAKQVFIDVFYCVAESENCKDYKLIINRDGELKIKDLNTPEN